MQPTAWRLTFTSISLFDHSPELQDKRDRMHHSHPSGRRLGTDVQSGFSLILFSTSGGRGTSFISHVLSLVTLSCKQEKFVLMKVKCA